jgi:hypothetical protein
MSDYSDKLEQSVRFTTPAEAFDMGLKAGQSKSLRRLILEIIDHDYSVNEVKGAIDNILEELEGMTPEQYEAEAKETAKTTSELF